SNACFKAKTPFLDTLKDTPLYYELKAHGTAVGMPTDNDMGNSEVGHNTLGAGRIFKQGSSLVKQSLESKTLFHNKTWKDGVQNCIHHNSTLHLIGLLSDGNVHNHIEYQIQLITQAVKDGITKIRLHCLLDGRDVESRSALTYAKTLQESTNKLACDIKIASGGGRMITTMDRYNADWRIVERGYNAHVHGIGNHVNTIEEAIQNAYKDPSITDQYIPPFVITNNKGPVGKIKTNDTVFITNFRGDRAIEISEAFENETFTNFDRGTHPKVFFAGMMQYDGDRHIPNRFLVNPPKIENPISTYLCDKNIRSLAISETQKYGHVTYFWNGNKSGYINKELETYIEIKSDLIPFDQAPNMKAYEITAKTIELLKTESYQFIRINFPNGDMVGHTGNFDATVKTMETINTCTETIVSTVNKLNGTTIILADHGNADEMFTIKNEKKIIKTAHSLNPVPCAIITKNPINYTKNTVNTPGLANVAATICNLLGYKKPDNYEPSLIQ
ncbi:2,3-bisphosphoglycerate-independent phosphoglycerate mutase, partial [Candidatus Marinamargulisbacteria bacterium SCGC AG-333-B06]